MTKWILAASSAVLMATSALAQDGNPLSGSVELVVPFAAGGGTDQAARGFAEFVRPHIGQDVFVNNRDGAGGAIGFRYGASARPDGRVITTLVTTLATAPHTTPDYPVTYADFAPICLLSAPPVVMSVKADGPIQSVHDLVAMAKNGDRPVSFGTGGVATYQHLAGILFTQAADIEGNFVAYRGAAPILTDAFGGHIDIALSEATEVLPWVKDGRMKVIAVFGSSPFSGFPDAPLSKDLGYDVEIGAFRAIGAPKDTPQPVLDFWVEACRKTTQDQQFVDHMGRLGVDVEPLFGEEFGAWIAAQHDAFAVAAKAISQ